jgi:hypothetical protein
MLREKRRPEDRPLSVALFVAKCESPAQAEGLGGATLEACRGVWGATKGCFKPKLLALIRQAKQEEIDPRLGKAHVRCQGQSRGGSAALGLRRQRSVVSRIFAALHLIVSHHWTS